MGVNYPYSDSSNMSQRKLLVYLISLSLTPCNRTNKTYIFILFDPYATFLVLPKELHSQLLVMILRPRWYLIDGNTLVAISISLGE